MSYVFQTGVGLSHVYLHVTAPFVMYLCQCLLSFRTLLAVIENEDDVSCCFRYISTKQNNLMSLWLSSLLQATRLFSLNFLKVAQALAGRKGSKFHL